MHQAGLLMQTPPHGSRPGETRVALAPAKIPASLFQHLPVRVGRSAGKRGGEGRVIGGMRGPEIVYDANIFKSSALPPLGKGA